MYRKAFRGLTNVANALMQVGQKRFATEFLPLIVENNALDLWLRGRLRAIGDTCPGGRGMISQQNRADVPREERKWYG